MEPELVGVADGVFAWVQPDGTWWLNNAGVVLGDGGPLLVDTCATEGRTRRFLAAVDGAAGGVAVRVAVNTHLHGDHTYGNCLLPDSTMIVGHQATRDGLLADFLLGAEVPFWEPAPRWGELTVRAPAVVPDGPLTIFVGGRRVEVRHPGYAAHTPGDLVVWLPDEGVLFTGDLVFNGITPMVLMGSVEGALRSLEWLASFGAKRVVPGHGALIEGAEFGDVLAAHERYYRFVLEVAREGGTPLEAARAAELGEFAAWPDDERLVLNLHRARAELNRTEVDIMAAMADAVSYHGGPLRCAV